MRRFLHLKKSHHGTRGDSLVNMNAGWTFADGFWKLIIGKERVSMEVHSKVRQNF